MKKFITLSVLLFTAALCGATSFYGNFIGNSIGNGQQLTNVPLTALQIAPATNDQTAQAYIARNQITSPIAQQAVYGQASTANSWGIYSNLAMLVNFRPEYNPTNHLDFFGNPFTVVNEQYTNGGFLCTYTNGFFMGGFSLTNNWTITITIDRQIFVPSSAGGGFSQSPTLATPNSHCMMFGFENTNTGSAIFTDYGEFKGTALYQKNQSVWPYQTNINNLPTLFHLGQLNYQLDYTVQKNVYCLSFINGTNYMWVNTLPFYYTAGPSQPLTSSIICTDALQMIDFGFSTNYAQDLWSGNTIWHTNSCEVVESVMLFTNAATPTSMNIVYGSYKMAQWPDWKQPYQFMYGDSIVAAMGQDLTLPSNWSQSYTNDFFYNLNSFNPNNPNWMNLAQGGSSLALLLTNSVTGQAWPIMPVSLLPQIDMGVPITIWSDAGRNNQPTNAPQNEGLISGWLTQLVAPYKALGGNVNWIQILTSPVALTNQAWNSFAGTLQFNANIASWNSTVRSNLSVNSTFDFDSAINTNNMVMGGPLSGDGVHPYMNNAAFLALAKYANGIQTDILTPLYSGVFNGNAASLTNQNWPTNFAKPTPLAGCAMMWSSNGWLYYLTAQHPNGVLITAP